MCPGTNDWIRGTWTRAEIEIVYWESISEGGSGAEIWDRREDQGHWASVMTSFSPGSVTQHPHSPHVGIVGFPPDALAITLHAAFGGGGGWA